MKNILLLVSLLLASSNVFAFDSDSTGLEGDNLDLNAVIEVFKDSDSPEDFEKKLNTQGSDVNNLDLNNDGEVDYIRVIDSGDSTSHALTLQVPVNETESQDVAVIEVEEVSKDTAQLQIVGDEELYGENYVLLPQSSKTSVVMVNVHAWRPVRHMYGPKYIFYVSPWRYKHHAKWYRPWRRLGWGVYHTNVVRHHHGHCRRVYSRHLTHAHKHYHHTHSPTFHGNHHHHHAGKTAVNKSPGKTSSKPVASPAPKNKAAASQKKTKTKSTQKRSSNSRKRPGRTKSNRGRN